MSFLKGHTVLMNGTPAEILLVPGDKHRDGWTLGATDYFVMAHCQPSGSPGRWATRVDARHLQALRYVEHDEEALTYFRRIKIEKDAFAPEIHEWLVRVGDKFLFPLKDTDRWSSYTKLSNFVECPKAAVPVEVRKKAGQRLGAFRRNGK